MRVRVGGVSVSVAHFVEVGGGFESLHGHNLVLSAQVGGRAKGGLLMDFRDLERILQQSASLIDHRLIVPKANPNLKITRRKGMLEIRTPRKRYLVPENDATLLPIRNSTVEEIARFIYEEVSRRLPSAVKLGYVSVHEDEGKTASFGSHA